MTYLGRERATETNETHAAADAVSATLAAASNILAQRVLQLDRKLLCWLLLMIQTSIPCFLNVLPLTHEV
jgi:hypothetical protein